MDTSAFPLFYEKHPLMQELSDEILKNTTNRIHLQGLVGSARSLICSTAFTQSKQPMLVIMNDKEEAAYFYNDLVGLLGEEKVMFFPSSYKRSVSKEITNKVDPANIILRTETLNRLSSGEHELVIVSHPGALCEKVISKINLQNNTLNLFVGEKISIQFIIEFLIEYRFERVDFVYEPGQFAVRGSIVDIFSFSSDYPYRLDFFGDEVETIKTFDLLTQLSKASFKKIAIIPNIQKQVDEEVRISFLEYIDPKTVVWAKDLKFTIGRIDFLYTKRITNNEMLDNGEDEPVRNPENLFIVGEDFAKKVLDFSTVEFGNSFLLKANSILSFNTSPQPDFNKNFAMLHADLDEKYLSGYTNYVLSESDKQIERLKKIFEAMKDVEKVDFEPLQSIVHEGFVDHDLKRCVYTDHQIFGRYHKFKLRTAYEASGKQALSIKELQDLHPGDYVVHVDHGIGVFGGLVSMEMNGKMQETIRLVYQDNDVLFVSIHSLHRISKYKGKDGEPPKVYKLGSGAWNKLKQKTKSKVKDIAKELIALYAARKAEKGFAFSADTYMQAELESSFIYEDTPDQLKATQAVKQDMENVIPMDRLVCGDVGFGKTEVAIRAAFKAVADSKQVAVLVPTTILALQHYHTFKDRLKDLPCKVDYVSRLRTAKEIKQALKDVEAGKVDILIGTHRIVGQDVKFKDLGLLIVDEEQKFGVAVKDKLKRLKVNVDTLTLTATPIPRTLQFSMLGARDLSVISTPPSNRYPIITELHPFNEDLIREAILFEVERNGQVFFINNRISNLYEIQALIGRLCPGVKSVVAHGQMEGGALEQIMMDFMNEEFDVLIATSIVESGLDVPNANTIIINEAQNFGLSDLHQLRGRVGRSNRKAFAYLLSRPLHELTQEARRRMHAIEEFSELGSGIHIAMQDLDIRGAGNLLGGEQSGFISDIGYETYQKILDEALMELKENEFRDLYQTEESKAEMPQIRFVNDCHLDTDLELMFPSKYIENDNERMKLYRDLDNIADEAALQTYEAQLTDRFGKLPVQSRELINVVRLRWLAMDLGFEKLVLKNGKMVCYFIQNQQSMFYESSVWRELLSYLQTSSLRMSFKESGGKLTLSFESVRSISKSMDLLKKMGEGVGVIGL